MWLYRGCYKGPYRVAPIYRRCLLPVFLGHTSDPVLGVETDTSTGSLLALLTSRVRWLPGCDVASPHGPDAVLRLECWSGCQVNAICLRQSEKYPHFFSVPFLVLTVAPVENIFSLMQI